MTHFLIADDSPNKMILMQGMLHRAQWKGEIITAVTSEDAMKLIDEHDIRFAFIDYYIPSENGPTIIKYLKKKNPDAHIALVSSADNTENFDEARNAGAELCICTSYPADEVEKMFTDVLADWKNAA
jgi:DNA-binding NarL/FixJ family response regulator